jgi:hypothetical protein
MRFSTFIKLIFWSYFLLFAVSTLKSVGCRFYQG